MLEGGSILPDVSVSRYLDREDGTLPFHLKEIDEEEEDGAGGSEVDRSWTLLEALSATSDADGPTRTSVFLAWVLQEGWRKDLLTAAPDVRQRRRQVARCTRKGLDGNRGGHGPRDQCADNRGAARRGRECRHSGGSRFGRANHRGCRSETPTPVIPSRTDPLIFLSRVHGTGCEKH